MNAQIELIEGTNRDVSKSQYFSPPKLAQRVVEWAIEGRPRGYDHSRPMRVLEPSAGNGALVRPLVAAGAEVTAVELDARYSLELKDALKQDSDQCPCDFLAMPGGSSLLGRFDLCVMNAPYHDDGEAKFVLHALKFAPRVVGIFRADVFYTVSRGEALWKHVRPTRVAFCSRRPWKGAETDYCVLELVKRRNVGLFWPNECQLEWWEDSW